MMHKRIIALTAAAVLLGTAALAPDSASARMGGGGFHGGMGGGFHGGMGGGFHGGMGGGHFGGHFGGMGPRFASRGFAGRGFAPRFARPGFHNRFAFRHGRAFRHFRFRRAFAFAAVPFVVDSGCWQWWYGRRVWVCGDYGY